MYFGICMKAFELRAARSLLDWTTEDLAYSCGVAAQNVQKMENENYLDAYNQDLKLSVRAEYLFREAMSWAGVDFTNNGQRQPTLALRPWAACIRPFKINVLPVKRPQETPYPETTFVRYGWFEPKGVIRTLGRKVRSEDTPVPALMCLPNEPDIFGSQNMNSSRRQELIIRAMNYSTSTYRRPFLKGMYLHKHSRLKVTDEPVPVIYLELDTEKASWCDIYYGYCERSEEVRSWCMTEAPEKIARVETAKINSSLADLEFLELLESYKGLRAFWEDKALHLETFLSSVWQLPLDVSSQFWSPGFCNRDRSHMSKLKAKVSPVGPVEDYEDLNKARRQRLFS
ncbi:hypothetical protein [Terasakiella pusilla]|uniref:hypothetical protein n=1 Tax=Terasakiella pusilla TaxID=64973 RepID=UPI003AA8A99F